MEILKKYRKCFFEILVKLWRKSEETGEYIVQIFRFVPLIPNSDGSYVYFFGLGRTRNIVNLCDRPIFARLFHIEDASPFAFPMNTCTQHHFHPRYSKLLHLQFDFLKTVSCYFKAVANNGLKSLDSFTFANKKQRINCCKQANCE